MSKGSQKPVPPIDLNTMEPAHTDPPETKAEKCLPVLSRAARLRAIHESVQANAYVVPAGLVAERMIEGVAGKRPSEE